MTNDGMNGTKTAANDERSLKTYVSDMLALERHISKPVQAQCDDADTARYAEAAAFTQGIKAKVEAHVNALETRLAALGGHAASPVKSAVSEVAGLFADVIDKMRKTKVSKNLRDDYTALSLASISYTMLQTTALAMHDEATASLAEAHLRDYASAIMQLSRIMPGVVVAELREDGEVVDPSIVARSVEQTVGAWK